MDLRPCDGPRLSVNITSANVLFLWRKSLSPNLSFNSLLQREYLSVRHSFFVLLVLHISNAKLGTIKVMLECFENDLEKIAKASLWAWGTQFTSFFCLSNVQYTYGQNCPE